MKNILFLFLFLPYFAHAVNKIEFVVENKNGYWCIIHHAQQGESLTALSVTFSVKVAVLANVNNISTSSTLKINQPIIIPLLETNYYKMIGISSAQKGFYPLYYIAVLADDAASICEKFQLTQSAFMKWNQLNNSDELKENGKVIVGWLKYMGSDLPSQNAVRVEEKLIKKSVTIPKPPVSANKTELKKEAVLKQEATVSQKPGVPKPVVAKPLSAKPVAPKPLAKKVEPKTETIKQKVVEPSPVYLENEKQKSEGKLSAFFRKVGSKFKRKEKTEEDEPESSSSTAVVQKKDDTKLEKKHTSLKDVWSRIVNGKKDTVSKPVAKEVSIPTKTTSNAKQINSSKSNTANQTNKSSLPASSKANVEANTKSKSKGTKGRLLASENKEKKVVPIVQEKQKEEIVDNTVRSEVKKLSLSKNKTGKCAFFFSGPVSGQFYVFTNLAKKGDIIKITNLQNNRSVLAEVIGPLPNADASKELIIKLSDNAKLPLGQKNTTFIVKVNY